MLAACEATLPVDVAVMAAAVSDWRVDTVSTQKLKKDGKGAPALHLVENPDILARIAGRHNDRPALVIGFAAETEQPGSIFVDVITQPGVGAIRGGFNTNFSDGAMTAKSPFVPIKGPQQSRGFGGNIGGALVKNKSNFSLSVNGSNSSGKTCRRAIPSVPTWRLEFL